MNESELNQRVMNSILQNEPEPQVVGGKRDLNPTEVMIVEESMPTIKTAEDDIVKATRDLGIVGNNTAIIQAGLEKDAADYKQKRSILENQLAEVKTKLEDVYRRIAWCRAQDNGIKEVKKPQSRGKGLNSKIGVWIILACLGIDLISLVSTWAFQRQVFGIDTIITRSIYVGGIILASFGLHIMHKHTGNKVALTCLCISLFMSFMVAVHTIILVQTTEEVATVSEFSLDLVDAAAETTSSPQPKSFAEKMFSEPGLAESLLMALIFVIALASILVENAKKEVPATQSVGQTPLQPASCVLSALNMTKVTLEQEKASLESDLNKLDQEFAQKKQGYEDRLNSLSEWADADAKVIVNAKKTYDKQVALTLQNLAAYLAVYKVMLAAYRHVPESSLEFPAVTKEDLYRYYYDMNVFNVNNPVINNLSGNLKNSIIFN